MCVQPLEARIEVRDVMQDLLDDLPPAGFLFDFAGGIVATGPGCQILKDLLKACPYLVESLP